MKKFTSLGNEAAARNIIGQGTLINGDIELNGDFRIDGKLLGSILSAGRIVIGPSGTVEGNVKCQNADISGKYTGKLEADDLTSLKATAVFAGELFTTRLAIEVGANFNGKCQMKDASISANVENKQ